MKQAALFSDFIYQVFSLIIALILVHAYYVAVVRPNADAVLAQQEVLQAQNPEFVQEVSLYVVLKDYEQEAELIEEMMRRDDEKRIQYKYNRIFRIRCRFI